ncbi:MAG: AraC family transcriptional regulator [Defluviitaleaceae bacterium]|nr:AraC family transcriptional regulator [Defluviitaleaceae bacterium]
MRQKDIITESWFPHGRFSDLTMYRFGHHYCKSGHVCGPGIWNNFLFHYVVSGKGRLFSATESGIINEYSLEPGQGFTFWPGQLNTFIADHDDPWEYLSVEFNGLRAKEALIQAGLLYDSPIYTSDNPQEHALMVRELEFINKNASRPPMELIGHLYGFVSALVHSSSKRNLADKDSHQDLYVQKALDYIEKYYHRDLTIQEIADFCGVHRSYLHRIFIDCLNTSPQQFLISFRIRKACELLITTDYSINKISALVGYTNPLNFSRIFKQERKKSPREWRKTQG